MPVMPKELMMETPDEIFLEAIRRQDETPVYKYKAYTTTHYDPSTGFVDIELGVNDIAVALEAAYNRTLDSEALGLTGRAGCKRDDGQIDLDGALAEVAFARAIRSAECPQSGTYKAPDIAGVQVRSTSLDTGRLIVRDCDCPDDVYVLATGQGPLWTVRGGIVGKAAPRLGYKYAPNNRDPAWFVPQSSLKTLDKSDRFGHLFKASQNDETVSPPRADG